jgi:DNA-binding transcriptional regulator YhcF (GntR family)
MDFSDRMRRALAMAREEAFRFRHDYIGPEHILLALLRERRGGARDVLTALDVSVDRLVEAVEGSVRPGRATSQPSQLPYTSLAKKVLEQAINAAREVVAPAVEGEHLLLALCREERHPVSKHLAGAGVTAEATLRQIRATRNDEAGAASTAGSSPSRGRGTSEARAKLLTSRPVWFLELDARSETPIYEQIIAGVEEAVATGRLETGERLPPVRQLAEELSLAPGTVARAYSELERRGVLETAGAKGTRVAPRSVNQTGDDTHDVVLEGLLRPSAIAAFHMGVTADRLRRALERAMKGILQGLIAL